ncbi:MAG: hypothetical protein Q8R13_02360 [bacterium]|nr:hypothetical protein [bacterium]
MNQFLLFSILLAAVSLAGFYLAYLYGHKVRRFRWSEYVMLLICPLIAIGLLAYSLGLRIVFLFVASMVSGTILEYLLGLAYHKTLNRRLWTYERLKIGGYTSVLSIPIWGVAGVIFWLIGKTLGL